MNTYLKTDIKQLGTFSSNEQIEKNRFSEHYEFNRNDGEKFTDFLLEFIEVQ